MGDQSQNIGHAMRLGNIVRGVSILLGIGSALGVVLGLVMGSWAWLLLLACLVGWLTLGGFALIHRTVIDPVGEAIGSALVPGGGSTPSVAQHSNIEAMEAQGKYAEAAAAYRAIIASSPADQVAPDRLGALAMRQLKDYALAVQAYREAERRAVEPKRKAGFALLVAGIYRDNLKDYGKAMVELRRIVSTYPDVPNRARLSTEIDELKAMHFEQT